MHIAASEITLTGSRTARVEHVREESLRITIGAAAAGNGGELTAAALAAGDRVTLSTAMVADHSYDGVEAAAEAEFEETAVEEPKLRAIRMIIEALTGRQIKVSRLDLQTQAPAPGTGQTPGSPPSAPVGWGIDYSLRETRYEQETASFTATGQLLTADGSRLDFRIELSMHREFAAESLIRLQLGDAALIDPLVVNFDGRAVELADTFFSFDLDLDGRPDLIPALRPGSGFLVLDRNGDGIINDGSELFGPATGNGFAELAHYDLDGNGWIDGNDPVFKKLAVMAQSEDGRQYLASLHALNIRALLLDSLATPFSLTDKDNVLLGQVRNTSLFVRGDGSVGTVQEIDLVA